MFNCSLLNYKCTRIVSFFTLLKVSHLLKVNYIVGSYAAFFSAGSIVGPLTGAYFGLSGTIGIFCLSMLLRALLVGFQPFLLIVHHLPGLCAALYWSSRHWMISLGLPLSCIILFIVHPVGGQVWWYSSYWCIPIGLSFFKEKPVYLDALSSTFIAHAVGSVVWLHGKPMTATMWLGLIPVVCFERLVFATGMTLVLLLVRNLVPYTQKKSCYA